MEDAIHGDIAIVGGGMVGLSLALLLARALPQKQILLLESRSFAAAGEAPAQPSFDSRSTALSPSSADVFEGLGVWQRLSKAASPIREIHVSDRGHAGNTRFGPEDNQGQPLGYVVPNPVLGQALLAQVRATANIRPLAPVNVQGLRPMRGGMRIEFKERPALRAELAILADGAGSPLAQGLGVANRVKDYGQCAIIANVEFEEPHQGRAFERFSEAGPMALLPLTPELAGLGQTSGSGHGRHRSALVWTQPLKRLSQVSAWSEQQFLHELQNAFGYRLGRFTRASARVAHPLALHLAEEQVRSSLVLMGNAAHSLHPVAGQGFNLALRDAAKLTQTLSHGSQAGLRLGELTLLQRYEQAQKRDQDVTVLLSDSFIRVFASGNPAVIAGRNLGLLSLELFGGWRDTFLLHMAGRAQPRARLDF